jgi:hypothetical protein
VRALRKRRSFLALDAAVAVGLTLVLALAFSAAYRQFASAHHHADARRELRLAADAELTRLRAAGLDGLKSPPTSQPAQRRINDVVLKTSVRPAEGVWAGMTQVTVVARRQVHGGWARVELSAYLPAPKVPP